MKTFILGIVAAIILFAAGAYILAATGSLPVATASSPLPFEKSLAKMALNARIKHEMPKDVPIQPDEANLLAGAHVYAEHCAVCHGLPGQPKAAIAKGMFPEPPELFHGKGVTDDPPGESYWKTVNGIRLSGMPGFKGNISDMELWQVSLLVANADKISPAVKAALTEKPASVQ